MGRRVERMFRTRKWNKFLIVKEFKSRNPKIKVPDRSEQVTSNPSAWRRGSVAKSYL